jgi:hypothetical protein
MATATANNSKATPTPENGHVPETHEVPEAAHKIREQVLTTVKQGQQLSIDAAEGWAKAVSALPIPDLPKIPGASAVPSLETATRFGFDVATDLLNNQRDYALKLTNVLAHAKTS